MLYHSKLQPMHWSVLVTNYTGDRLPSVQPSAESVCNPVMHPDSPSTTRLPNSLHPAVWLVTQSLLQLENLCTDSLCLDHLYVHHWESPCQIFYRGKGNCSTAPLFQPCEAGGTVAYMKGYAEGDISSPDIAATLEVAKVITIINEVQCSHKACRTTALGM